MNASSGSQVLPELAPSSLSARAQMTPLQIYTAASIRTGDFIGKLIINTSAGNFTYKIFGFRIVKADDRTVIVSTRTAVLTLSTCYPFRYIGDAPKRYIVSADLISQAPIS